MDNEERKRREEENRQFLKRLIDSEAETRADVPIEPEDDEPVDPSATTKASPPRRTPTPPARIPLDENNLPLPRRVDELDLEGTRVSTVAFEPPSRPRNAQTRVARPPTVPPVQPPITGTILQLRIGGLMLVDFSALFVVLCLSLAGRCFFSYYASPHLPSVEDLQNRSTVRDHVF
jgi:hypothetical protein